MKNQTVAAIDIGSNSIKLAVVQAAASDSFTVILQERERVRLGETLRERFLSPEAIEKSAAAIAKFRSMAESRDAQTIIAVATASVREATNANEFVYEIERRTGVRVEVLSAIEEARLIGVAAANFFRRKKGTLLNVDIGGGSTELSLMRDAAPEKLFSMKLGAVGLKEKFLFTNPPKEKELKNLRDEIRLALERPVRELAGDLWQMTSGTSGTILNLASLININRTEISLKKLIALNENLARMTNAERATLPSISPTRAEVIVSGGQILEGVMRGLQIETLKPCGYALREGVIIEHLRVIEAESLPPVPDVEDAKLRGVFAIGRRFGYEEKHALQVAALAEKIFDQLAPLYDLPRKQRALLSAAALLHNVGYHVSHEAHHKHSLYLIKHSEITGFSENEKQIIANVARYHRGNPPKEKHLDFIVLSDRDRETVWRLGGILRVANALDRGYENRVRDVRFKRSGQNLALEIFSESSIESELQAVEARKEMFETAFNCSLTATAGNTKKAKGN
jgi:exopolyphosphatase / guanosine-5'-triphosphate,3'-diphosphate pyrophosphatase